MNRGSPAPDDRFDASGMRVGVAVSRWNREVTSRLLDGAIECLREYGAGEGSIQIHWCAGAFELPLLAKELAVAGCDGVVALGCVIRGETDHNVYIATAVASGLMNAMLETGVPIAFGVLTTDDLEQALARSGNGRENKGFEAAETLVSQVAAIRSVRSG